MTQQTMTTHIIHIKSITPVRDHAASHSKITRSPRRNVTPCAAATLWGAATQFADIRWCPTRFCAIDSKAKLNWIEDQRDTNHHGARSCIPAILHRGASNERQPVTKLYMRSVAIDWPLSTHTHTHAYLHITTICSRQRRFGHSLRSGISIARPTLEDDRAARVQCGQGVHNWFWRWIPERTEGAQNNWIPEPPAHAHTQLRCGWDPKDRERDRSTEKAYLSDGTPLGRSARRFPRRAKVNRKQTI